MKRRTSRRLSITKTILAAGGLLAACVLLAAACPDRASAKAPGAFRAGAAAVDITPTHFPAIVSGGFLERTAGGVRDPLYARCLVMDDGRTRVAIVVVDTLLMARELIDDAKARAEKATGIPTDHILVAATHTHSAPSVVGALGTGVDEHYVKLLPGWIAEAIGRAARNVAPAKVGWTVVDDFQHTHCRRWITRPDRMGSDPFGGRTVRAMMHPGYQNPAYVGPSGPADAGLTILSVRTPDGRPVALLANYSMHYFGASPVSADYYGRFCRIMAKLLGPEQADPPVVAMMSQGTSGDLHWMDYGQPRKAIGIDQYAEEVAKVAFDAYQKIQYHDSAPLAMAERKLRLKRRVPDQKRLAWARQIVKKVQGRKPKNRPEVYALEQVYLHDEPERELKLQAVRVGELGMAAIPCEVYGITGLKIKAQSPLVPTLNFELTNGAEGYIPPPEQHKLGGYTTWPARSAGLEVQAEPRIVETVLQLLEEVSGRPRRKPDQPPGPYAKAVLESKPLAYWRLGELTGPGAADATEHGNVGRYEDGVAFYLEGPDSPGFCGPGVINRAPHFAGGRMEAVLRGLGSTYSVELWFTNCLPGDARAVTGHLFSRGADGQKDAAGDHLGIGGTAGNSGKLFFYNGDSLKETLAGTTEIPPKKWTHVVLVRDGRKVAVYLNGNPKPEVSGEAAAGFAPDCVQVFVGGRNDNLANFEGRIDEAALYDRALSPEEIARHYAAK